MFRFLGIIFFAVTALLALSYMFFGKDAYEIFNEETYGSCAFIAVVVGLIITITGTISNSWITLLGIVFILIGLLFLICFLLEENFYKYLPHKSIDKK